MSALKKVVFQILKETNEAFADFSEGDTRMVEELTSVDIDTEKQVICVKFPNMWVDAGDERTETVNLTTFDLINFMLTKMQSNGIL
jgi:hypothetical protein